jgi:transcriptional regulator with XRE-family HTH domain
VPINNKFKNAVGANVRKFRMEKGLQQQDLAIACNLLGFDISRSGIGQIEMHHRQVIDIELILLARALEVSVLDLIPDIENMPQWKPRYTNSDPEE